MRLCVFDCFLHVFVHAVDVCSFVGVRVFVCVVAFAVLV